MYWKDLYLYLYIKIHRVRFGRAICLARAISTYADKQIKDYITSDVDGKTAETRILNLNLLGIYLC